MSNINYHLISAADVQKQLADHLKTCRQTAGFSRRELSEKSSVPASTLRKFEQTGQISLRQFLLLWQSLDDLSRVGALTQKPPTLPARIDEVLSS